jgi:hypothetical protein
MIRFFFPILPADPFFSIDTLLITDIPILPVSVTLSALGKNENGKNYFNPLLAAPLERRMTGKNSSLLWISSATAHTEARNSTSCHV